MSKMTDAKWPAKDEKFDTYKLGYKPDPYQRNPVGLWRTWVIILILQNSQMVILI